MKTLKKVLVVVLFVLFTMSMCAFSVFAAEDDTKTFTATGNAKEGGSQLSVTFSITGLGTNCQRADLVTGIGDHIKVNGVLVSEATEEDVASQVQIHQRSNMFWVYTSGYQFQKGDTIEFLAGMGFVQAGAGDEVCTADSPKLDMTLAENYSLIMTLTGDWAVQPSDGVLDISGLDPVAQVEENLKDYAAKTLTLKFESLFSADVMNNLQDDSTIADKILFRGKTVTQINEENDLLNKLDQPVDAIIIDSSASALVFTIDNRAKVDGEDVLANLATFTIQPMTTPSGLEIAEEYTRTYYSSYDYWVKDVSPVIPAEGDQVLHFKNVVGNWADPTNKLIQFEFYEQIIDETNASANNANFYASLPRWIVTNATGRTVESVDKAVSSGAYEAALTKILVDGQDIRTIQAAIEGDAAKSTAVMVHYNDTNMDLYIPATMIDLETDHVITIKAGMVFPTGYYVAEDMVINYKASEGDLSATDVTGIALDKTEGTLLVGDTETLAVTFTPANATDKMIIWTSSDDSVATVVNGTVTAVGKGTATITATSAANGEIKATYTVTVGEAATGIALDKTELSLKVGENQTLTATVSPEGALAELTWTSSDDSIATVENGKVTAKKVGTVTITVSTDNGKTAVCTVTVSETTDGGNQGGTDQDGTDTEKTGCGSSIVASSAVIAVFAMAAVVVFVMKRKENR